jgi:hypothetical protein
MHCADNMQSCSMLQQVVGQLEMVNDGTKRLSQHTKSCYLIHSLIGMCRMRRFLAILSSFFHSSLFCTFSCHPSVPTILPSSLTSSYHLFLGLPLNLVVPKYIYNTLLGIIFSSILCTCPNKRNLFTLVNIKYSTSLHKRHDQHTWCQTTYHSLHRIFNMSVNKPYLMFWNPEILHTPMARALLPSRRKQNLLCNEL